MVSGRVFERAASRFEMKPASYSTAAGNNLFMQVSPLRGALKTFLVCVCLSLSRTHTLA
jgi:hypothetical protein